MHEYRHVLSRMRLGESDRQIARSGLMGRPKAGELRRLAEGEGWLDPGTPLPDEKTLASYLTRTPSPRQESSLTAHRERIRQWVEEGIAGTAIHAALQRNHGYAGSYSSVRRFIQGIRSETRCTTVVLEFAPGEAAQVDFGKGPEIIDQETGEVIKTWYFVMTLAWSRHQYAELIRHQDVETWLGCHRRAFEHFGGVPRRVIIDNPKCAIVKACYTDPLVQRSYRDCAEDYGFLISPCPVADPKKKGRVESGVKYVKNHFGPLRTFRSLADANAQLMEWVMTTAGHRCHGTTRVAPLRRFEDTEKAMLQPLPDQPAELVRWAQCKLHGDCHIQVDNAYYSAPWKHVGETLDVSLSESSVRLYVNHDMVAIHPRARRKGQRCTSREHYPPEYLAWKMRDPQWCLTQSKKVGAQCERFILALLGDQVVDRLRAAQGVLRYRKSYGDIRLEAACARALRFGNITYRAVRSILENDLDQTTDSATDCAPLSAAYSGEGRFCRTSRDLFSQQKEIS